MSSTPPVTINSTNSTNNNIYIINNNSHCSHESTSTSTLNDTISFSGDLICAHCGQVLQNNSQLASEPVYLDRDRKYTGTSAISAISSSGFNSAPSLTHQERSELALTALLRKLITSFALKPSYEPETLQLMHRYWDHAAPKQKYGLVGNRLLVATVFLLARRDRLAVNLNLLAASIDSTPQECGVFLDPLIQLEPSLRSLAKVDDFIPRSLDLVINQLCLNYGFALKDGSHLHFLAQETFWIAELLKEEESGSSRSAECTALAATWITFSALLIDSKISLDPVIKIVTESSTLSFKTVKLKYNSLIDKLLERAEILLPSTFSLKLTRPRKISLLLHHLQEIINF